MRLKMADEAENSSEAEAKYRNGAIMEVLNRIQPCLSRFFCDECGDEIPEARRVAMPGCTLCIDCQKDFEKKGYEYECETI